MSVPHICRSLLLGAALLTAIFVSAAQAKHYQVLHSFDGSDGSYANGNLQLDNAGNLYGTAATGGAFGLGTIFRLDSAGTFTVVHSFTGGDDGSEPEAGLVLDPATGDLYGTTTGGGKQAYGGIFKLTTAGDLVDLHDFRRTADGDQPFGALLRDRRGNLYGTTFQDGPEHGGAVFKLTAEGGFKVLHALRGSDGTEPVGRLVRSGPNLYGIAQIGGSGSGTIFKAATDGTFTKLYTPNQGVGLSGGLARDKVGNLYGPYLNAGENGKGIIYALSPGGTLSTLHTFAGGTDGQYPLGDMLLTKKGKLYGATARGGGASDDGMIFALDLQGNLTSLHGFTGAPDDGATPSGGLIEGKDGKLYGTTTKGGSHDMGVIFSVTAR